MNIPNKIDPVITISSTEMKLFDSEECNKTDSELEHKKYSKSDKKIIASRIEQINNKKIYIKLFKIISNDNNNYTANSNGVFLNLNNLQDKTLSKIEHVLDIYEKFKKNKITNNKWNILLQTQYNSQNHNHVQNVFDDKYTNHEKMFLKRQQTNNNDEITFWGAKQTDSTSISTSTSTSTSTPTSNKNKTDVSIKKTIDSDEVGSSFP